MHLRIVPLPEFIDSRFYYGLKGYAAYVFFIFIARKIEKNVSIYPFFSKVCWKFY